MRSNVSWKRGRVSRSILRIACSSVVSASVRSANCRSRYSLRSVCSLHLVDGRQVDLPEPLDLRAPPRGRPPRRDAARRPGRRARSAGRHWSPRTARRGSRAARASPGWRARGIHRLARRFARVLRREPLSSSARTLSRCSPPRARDRQLRLDVEPQREGILQARLRLRDRCVARGQLRLEVAAPAPELRDCSFMRSRPVAGSRSSGATPRALQVTRASAAAPARRRVRPSAHRAAPHARRLCLRAGSPATPAAPGRAQLLAGARQRLLRAAALARELGGVLLQPLAALVDLPRARSAAFSAASQVHVLAVGAG